MSEYKPSVINIKNLDEARKEIKKIGSDPASIEIMAEKAVLKTIKLNNIVLQDAIIIKQDMLSIGGEVAVPKNTFKLHEEKADILIIGTIKQHRELTQKLRRHYPRLKKIAEEINKFLKDVL